MERKDIKRNKTLRAWYRYRKPLCLILAAVLVVVGIIVLIGKIGRSETENESVVNTTEEPATELVTEPVTLETEPVTEEPTTEPEPAVRTPAVEEFTNTEFYNDAVVVGDTFVAGIELYSYLDSDKIICDTSWTTGKAEANAISALTSSGASKVIIEIGINDLNYEGRDAQRVYSDYASLVAAVRGALPDAEIYVVSVFPVTSGFESKSNILISNSSVKELNELLEGMEGVQYIDVYSSLVDGTGCLNTDLSNNGLNIKKTYYPFILNLIAELAQ